MAVHLQARYGFGIGSLPKNTLFEWDGAPQNGDYSKMYPWMAELAAHLDADGQAAAKELLSALKTVHDLNTAPTVEMEEACEEKMAAFKSYVASLSMAERLRLEREMIGFVEG